MFLKSLSSAIALLLLLTACASTEQSQKDKPVDPRQGEAVNQICFTGNMDGWSPLEGDNKALIVFDRRDDAYKLDLVGTCDPQWAMMRIATVSRGASNCLSRGDKIFTDAGMSRHDSCTIMKIYKWHPENVTDEKKPSETEKPAEQDSTEN
ncbi:DUF6491 family protein [Thalassotalea nanhaiensis]|uniref:DUF6491 family protein n=1 Tax=Thalassotalea nanhaiensis TaxID=3065648 RepID=A0ABY9TJL5_9GAMM|nr:DUF6491 family protein [Colwelliaceae bacterium SQ345]